MLDNKITCLILSCDKFSDLWDGNVRLFNENWRDRKFETYIVTDRHSQKLYPGVSIISAGADVEWSDRLAIALRRIKTQFVFITLDDYYLIKAVDSAKIEKMVDYMEQNKYDYLRLFRNPPKAKSDELVEIKGVYHVDTRYEYCVNLYAGIWDIEFLKSCIKEPMDAWHFEVSLQQRAIEYGAKCLVSLNDDYIILDVVRKGKILRRANAFFQKHPDIYKGNRAVNTRWYEFTLGIKELGSKVIPTWLVPLCRKFLMLFGLKFYSTENGYGRKDSCNSTDL